MRIREICLQIATFGTVGELPGGSIIASIYAIAFIGLNRLAYWIKPAFGQVFFIGFLILGCLIIQLALGAISEKDPSIIVLDKVIGIMVVFAGISLMITQWKLLLAAFILFHLLLLAKPLILFHRSLRKLDDLPGFLGIVSSDILFGIVVNLFLRFGIWAFY